MGGDEDLEDVQLDADKQEDGPVDNMHVDIQLSLEHRLARRLEKARRDDSLFIPEQLDAIVQLDPCHHEGVEDAWNSLRAKSWTEYEESLFGRDFQKAYTDECIAQEAFELLRDVDSVRCQLEVAELRALGLRLGYRTRWWLRGQC